MTRVLGCEIAREMLPGLVDNELPLADQVAIEAHLRWCRTCGAHVEDLRLIGDALRFRLPLLADDMDLDGLQAGVLSRWSAEHAMSWTACVRRTIDDPHVLWAGFGAAVGVMACLLLTVGVMSATDERAADSLAAVMDAIGSPGSDQNPVHLDGRMAPPRLAIPQLFDDSPLLNRIPTNDAVFALAAIITRDGRVADFELLSHTASSDREPMPPSLEGKGRATRSDMSLLRDAVSNSRFAPAQSGGSPVAVNMVWLLARTTVKGSPRPFDFDEFRPRSRTRPVL